MTQEYKGYLLIARLVAERARLIRLLEFYPPHTQKGAEYESRLREVSAVLMFHQTFGGGR